MIDYALRFVLQFLQHVLVLFEPSLCGERMPLAEALLPYLIQAVAFSQQTGFWSGGDFILYQYLLAGRLRGQRFEFRSPKS